jgi:hypothetical protein
MTSDFVVVPDPDLDVVGELVEACPSFCAVLEDIVIRFWNPETPPRPRHRL